MTHPCHVQQVVERLKYTVFGFDTFYVTSVENYKSDGVVFKGNMRGKDPQASYQKMSARMKVGFQVSSGLGPIHGFSDNQTLSS